MLVKLKQGELERLIPAVATGNQFNVASGDPRKILQRIIISSIGGVITLLISQSQISSQFYSLWLILGVVFLQYILWGPILEASIKNSKLRKLNNAALFEGEVLDLYTKEKIENRHEQANKLGELEYVESRRTWLFIDIGDEDGYLTQLKFPLENKHQIIRPGCNIRCLVFGNDLNFNSIIITSDAWFPREKIWAGEYPFLLRPAFEELCYYKLDRSMR